jgi:hypothetical protein
VSWLRYLAYAAAAITPIVLYRLASGSSSASGPMLSTAGGKPPPWWSAADYRALYASAGRLGMSAADLLLVEASESGLNPAASYPGGFAVGLNQLTSASNALTGLTEAEREAVTSMSVAQQIPIVERYFRNLQWTREGRGYPTAGVVYAQNFLPGRAIARGAAPDTVLGTVEEFPPDAGLADASGNYTVRSLEAHLRRVAGGATYKGALQAMRDATGDGSLSPRFAT